MCDSYWWKSEDTDFTTVIYEIKQCYQDDDGLFAARRRVATRKMKQMKHNSSKEADDLELDEENEELFREIGKSSILKVWGFNNIYLYSAASKLRSNFNLSSVFWDLLFSVNYFNDSKIIEVCFLSGIVNYIYVNYKM